MTLLELLIVLVVLAVLFSVTTHCWTSAIEKGQMAQSLSNMRQLHLATMAAYLDGTGPRQPPAWPGDLDSSFSRWAEVLTQEGWYLTTNDFCKLLSAPGVAVPPGKLPAREQSTILVYAVREESSTNTLFLSTANFTNSPTGGAPLAKEAKPYGTRGDLSSCGKTAKERCSGQMRSDRRIPSAPLRRSAADSILPPFGGETPLRSPSEPLSHLSLRRMINRPSAPRQSLPL